MIQYLLVNQFLKTTPVFYYWILMITSQRSHYHATRSAEVFINFEGNYLHSNYQFLYCKLRFYIDLITHILFSLLCEFIYGYRKLSFFSSQVNLFSLFSLLFAIARARICIIDVINRINIIVNIINIT